ncbi:unnamed protein product [Hydatigera taeniaeformis]|uniref:Uncharacterized protein n=1 Tax=Hydatigena taeniaeformis TaxID=6205 RepID=A0A0R3X4W4_HYDTA|nr:unnamed protein product [Hydatigera taeniaeformis]
MPFGNASKTPILRVVSSPILSVSLNVSPFVRHMRRSAQSLGYAQITS